MHFQAIAPEPLPQRLVLYDDGIIFCTKQKLKRVASFSGTATQTRGGRTVWATGGTVKGRVRFKTSENDTSAGGRSDGVGGGVVAGGDEIAGKWRRPAGGCIWSPSARCSYRPRPRLVFACWRGDRGKLLHAAHPRWPILSHDEAGLIPGRVLIGWRGREHLIEAFDRLREEQRGQVSRAC